MIFTALAYIDDVSLKSKNDLTSEDYCNIMELNLFR